jgi:cytochrome P450
MSKLASSDFMDADTIQSPFDYYAAARKEAPVYKLPKSPVPGQDVYLVTRFEDIQRIVQDWRTFSNRFGFLMGGKDRGDPEIQEIVKDAVPTVDVLLTQDPPLHRTYRAVINKEFSFRKVEQMDEYIRGICDTLIDQFIDSGKCDFFHDFAVPLPMYVISDKLGIPRSDMDLFKRWTTDAVANIGRLKGRDAALRSARSAIEMQAYFLRLIDERRASPGEDLISALAGATFNDERPLTREEVLSFILSVLVAGNETATNALAGGMVYFLRDPQGPDRFAADPSLIPNAVDEILRLEASTKHMWRVVTEDTEVAGTRLPAGAVLLLSYDSANRDETVFPEPNRCDFARPNAADHLSFGAGIHHCLGALVARKELAIAFERLFARLEDIQITDEQPLTYVLSILHRGYEHLNLSFRPRSAGG